MAFFLVDPLALGNGEILGERGAADQTNSGPLFPVGLSVTIWKALFWKVPRGGPYFPHLRHQYDVHIIVILLVISIFFSSFNEVDLLRSVLADCCVPRHQEWGAIVAVGGRQPPWLACVYFA
jgi:hypothetical protein